MYEDQKTADDTFDAKLEKAKMAVVNLILKADDNFRNDGGDAMKFAQAATNAANALTALVLLPA